MPITCPYCSHVNPDQSGFCASCGNRLQSTGQMVTGPAGPSLPTYVASNQGSVPLTSTAAPSPATGPTYASSPSPTSPQPSPYFPAPFDVSPYLSSQLAPPAAVAPPPITTPMGTGQGLASIRRAFAGRGTLIFHHSWLLNGKQVQAATVQATIFGILQQRSIAGLTVNSERLMERGLLMEARDYLTVRRGVSTVFVYVAPAGQDLYISRATTALPLVSYARVAILCLLLLLMVFGFAAQQSLVTPSYPYGLPTVNLVNVGLTILFYPLLLFFIVLLIRSFIHWIVEKDFWLYLRPNQLNDFQLDDIALLEHATDDTVRAAAEQLKLDASKIVPPSLGYQPKQKIRLI